MVTLSEIVASCAKAAEGAPSRPWKERPHHGALHRDQPPGERGRPDRQERVADLFNKEKDPITLIKLKEVYEFFENTIDSCEDVADVLQNVVVKNS
jgi:hypothetical protein